MFCTHPHRQVLAKHGNAMRALQELQRKARNRRNCLSRRLRGTKEELLRTKDALYRLQLLSEDCSLEEREGLSHRLALITVDLHRKNKRIQVFSFGKVLFSQLLLKNSSYIHLIIYTHKNGNKA
jgi:hypothetical protein